MIGNGVVLDPAVLIDEIDMIKKRGYLKNDSQLMISEETHLILPYHRRIDAAREKIFKIGTTGRGIGPAYEDKVARCGIRVADLMDERVFREKLESNLIQKNVYLTQVLKEDGFDFAGIFDEYLRYKSRLERYVTNTSFALYQAIEKGKKRPVRRRAGSPAGSGSRHLSLRHFFEYAGGKCLCGLGNWPDDDPCGHRGCKGLYHPRGEGPFPTELEDEWGEKIREKGGEYGATTGRPRRCGWFDAVVVNHAIRVNGIRKIVMTKLDVLNDFDTIKVCVGYRAEGKVFHHVPPISRS